MPRAGSGRVVPVLSEGGTMMKKRERFYRVLDVLFFI
jgi:hypothetical protein